ncbi:MAG: LysR family transcriptional regulator [Gammaproteobacteria bacterium]|nr:LysR family transcriptional regulator [Gammaproteobacteria bacterium]
MGGLGERTMDLRQIDCFLAVATELHFGKAAERLHLAQSSVSEGIRALEHEIGGRLFIRTSRRVQLTDLGAKLRLGVEPAALVFRATLEDCRKTALGKSNRLRIGFLGGGLYELTLPFVRQLKSRFNIDVDWVELTLLDQFEAVAAGKVDAAFCRLPLSRDGLVQSAILFEDKRKLVVPVDHRLADKTLVDPEELALETLPALPDGHQLGAWAAIHFPDHTPSGLPIARGPAVTTVRECLAAVESGKAVAIFGGRAERYYSNPGIRYIEIDLPPVGTALVRRRADRRRVMADLEKCSRDVAEGMLDLPRPEARTAMRGRGWEFADAEG